MNIQQVSRFTQLSARQIRDYECKGLLGTVSRSENGYRSYTTLDVQRLKFIHRARQVGFSLAQIQDLLALYDNPTRNNSLVKQLTAQHIHTLSQQIEHLNAIKAMLEHWQQQCADDGSAECHILKQLEQS